MERKKIEVGELYTLCNKERFFTCGSCEQYDKMFALAKDGITQMELSQLLYLCSTQRHDYIYSSLIELFKGVENETNKKTNRHNH